MAYELKGEWPDGMLAEIDAILSRHHEWPAGLDSYDAVFDSSTFYPLQRRRELEAMMRVCREASPQTVMVIGADRGGDVFHFIKCLPTVAKVVACEIRGTPYAPLFMRYFPTIDFYFSEQGSRDGETLDQVNKFCSQIDVLFIDGDKNAFYDDFVAYRHLLRPGSIVLVHDICIPSCHDAFFSISRNHRSESIVDMSEHGEDKKSEAPVKNAYGGWVRFWNKTPTCGVGVVRI